MSIVCTTVVLSAMQVTFSMERSSSDTHFQAFSSYAAIISLSFVLLTLTLMMTVWAVIFCYHPSYTRQNCKNTEHSRRMLSI